MVYFAEKPQAPIGLHSGILYQIIDLGTQVVSFPGKEPTLTPKIRFCFELPDEKMDDGRPFGISKDYTVSLSDKASLVIDIKSWTGEEVKRGFDFKKLLGKAGNLNVVHNDNGYAKIASITPLMKGQKPAAGSNSLVYFDLETFDQDESVLAVLPTFLQEMIKKSPEFKIMQKHGCGLKEARVKEQEARKQSNPMAGHPAFDDEVGF